MSRASSRPSWRLRRLGVTAAILAGGWGVVPGQPLAAETADPVPMRTTRITLQVDREDPVAVRTRFLERPPTVILEFPLEQVVGALPERSSFRSGVIRGIVTQYDASSERGAGPRAVRSLQIILAELYPYRVRSEVGQVVVEIDHPVSVGAASLDVGLRGGTIIRGRELSPVTERFLAMQRALSTVRATQSTWTPRPVPRPTADSLRTEPWARSPAGGPRQGRPASAPSWIWLSIGLAAAAAGSVGAGWWLASRAAARRRLRAGAGAGPGTTRLTSAVQLIDQLVWRAFERQGFQLLRTIDVPRPPGLLRVMVREGTKAGLLCVGNGTFFEKQTVEQFVGALRQCELDNGVLVASGAFTVPAQRAAKESRVTLIGREQLIELLSAGATSEYFGKRLEESHARYEEARETLRQYAEQLDTFRRQRNEASWHLGEERAKAGRLEAELEATAHQARQQEAELARWRQDHALLRKQWDENQWYLGESRERCRHLEGQLTSVQQLAAALEAAERARDEANWYLGEERTKIQELSAELVAAQKALDAAVQRELALQDAFDQIRRSLSALQTFGERRRARRIGVPDARIELRDGRKRGVLFAGGLEDLSETGFKLTSSEALPEGPLRIRLHIPGWDEPVQSRVRRVWQRPDGEPISHVSGWQLTHVPEETRTRLQELVGRSQS